MARKKQKFLGDDLNEIAEQLEVVEKLLDRTKVIYEQYFMGIQKVPPSQLHRDIERKVRELTQKQIRNTSLRYRLTTVTQKFGVYNTYWRRILRQIEQGTYIRDVARVQRRARRRGEDVPEEILAAMPRRMRDRVLRDRELVARRAEREGHIPDETAGETADATAGETGASHEGGTVRRPRPHAHQVDADALNDDFDIDALFANLTSEAESAVDALRARPTAPAKSAPAKSDTADSSIDDDETRPFRAIARPLGMANKPRRRQPPAVLAPSDPPRRERAGTAPPIPVATPRAPSQPRKRATTAPPPPIPVAARTPPARTPPARTPPPPPARASRSSAVSLPPGMTEDKARALYQRFLKARKQVGKSTDVRYDDLVKSLNRQAPALMKQHKARGVEFDVAVQGDKVILKAKPKR